ncbi:MAG: 2,3-dimethylmalate dehydratase large subunit [Firmicutes bacterium ADurb.Bin182]|nr:MAG: 2,3-dimethylmalate dehydratase large subunit [Firmicutes bacterium ADurb.Bin182]
MLELIKEGIYLVNGEPVKSGEGILPPEQAREKTIAYSILRAHDKSENPEKMRIKFDSLASHDITYVGIIQSARIGGLKEFPVPYAMTNCHNSLCAVGGTINEDDHVFGLSAARKYGGIFVPVNQSVIHMYAREALAACGNMILGSDSHTRYGALGTMGVGEGGPEIVKQLLSNTYDIDAPEVVLVYLEGTPKPGVGPHDVAITLVAATFSNGFVKNKVMEFAGPGVKNLPVEFRNGIDVMTTETTCLSSVWETDDKVKEYFTVHKRPEAYKELKPGNGAYYDGMIRIDLSEIECMIALPFHPSNAYTIKELNADPKDIFASVEKEANSLFGEKIGFSLMSKIKNGRIYADQGIIAGCAGGLFDNICDAAAILEGGSTGNGYFSLSVYPGSMPVSIELSRNGVLTKLMAAGAVVKPAFCGPCFGAGDVPANNGFSIRHTTRNFPNREGSKPGQGQISSVALMDARSIAATARNQGALTPATECEHCIGGQKYHFDESIYEKRVYNGFGKPMRDEELKMGPNITDWPLMYPLTENLFLELTAVIKDPVTTTDELIPSGETSSYRSNPRKLAEFTLSRRVPEYVVLSKQAAKLEEDRRAGKLPEKVLSALSRVVGDPAQTLKETAIGSAIFANKPGDGSAREQAASSQKVLGGLANICYEYATKRYRSNCINWGIVPFTIDRETPFDYEQGDFVYVPNIREAIERGREEIPAKVITKNSVHDIILYVKNLTKDEKSIILEGCLMNFYAAKNK